MSNGVMARLVTLIVGALVAAGCGESISSTAPTGVSGGQVLGGSGIPSNSVVSQNATSATTVVSIPVAFTIQPSGKAAIQACVGETVTFSGDARLVAHQTTLTDGSVVLDGLHINPQGAVATGDSTDLPYRFAGADNNPIVLAPSGTLTATFSASLLVIGPGTSTNFTAHILQHITMTPAGAITALVDVFDAACG